MATSSRWEDRRFFTYTYLFHQVILQLIPNGSPDYTALWKTHTLASLLIIGGYECAHWYAISDYKQRLQRGEVDKALIAQGESLLARLLSPGDRQELERLTYQKLLRSLESESLLRAARKLADIFEIIPFEARFLLYQKFRREEDRKKALEYELNRPMNFRFENVIQCYIAGNPRKICRTDNVWTTLTEESAEVLSGYLFGLGFYYFCGVAGGGLWAKSVVKKGLNDTKLLWTAEKYDVLGFYDILGLSLLALMSYEEQLGKKRFSELMDQTLKISIEEVPELESESIEDIVLKAGLIERAKEQLETVLNEVPDSEIVKRIRKIQEEKVQPGRGIKG